jgi:hypothetical protein
MDIRKAYCATCDRSVRVLVKKEAAAWPSPQEPDMEDIVCLEYEETCTGGMCPIFGVPSDEMKKKLDEYRASQGG